MTDEAVYTLCRFHPQLRSLFLSQNNLSNFSVERISVTLHELEKLSLANFIDVENRNRFDRNYKLVLMLRVSKLRGYSQRDNTVRMFRSLIPIPVATGADKLNELFKRDVGDIEDRPNEIYDDLLE